MYIEYFDHNPSLPKTVVSAGNDNVWGFVEYYADGVVKRRSKFFDGFLPTTRGPVYQECDEKGYVIFQISGRDVLRYRIYNNDQITSNALEEAEAIKQSKLAQGYKIKTKPQKKVFPNRGRPKKN